VSILIKNPQVERKARELAARQGKTITAAIDRALDRALEESLPKRPRPTVEEIEAATRRMWENAGLHPPLPPVTKDEWDEINEIPGLAEGEG
jgi:antitoxin VapB